MKKLGGTMFFENVDMFTFFQTRIREPWIVETIESDVQTYGEDVLDKIFTGLDLKNCLGDIAERLVQPICQLDKTQYKEAEKIYLDFIKYIAQNKRALKNIPQENPTAQGILLIEADEVIENEVYEKSQNYLSRLEQSALLYLKYKNLIELDTQNQAFEDIDEDIKEMIITQKENLQALKHFTPQGIMQLANRAGLKMIFRERR